MTNEVHREDKKSYSYLQFVRDLIYFFKKDKTKALVLSLLRCVSGLLVLVVPFMSGLVIDEVTKPSANFELVFVYLFFLFASMLGGLLIRIFTNHYFELISFQAVTKMRLLAFSKLLAQKLEWHEDENTGNKMQRITSGARAMKDMYRAYIHELIEASIVILATGWLFTFLNLKYVLIILVFVAVFGFTSAYFTRLDLLGQRELNKKFEEIYGKLYEFAGNIFTVKSLGLTSALLVRGKESEADAFRVARKARLNRSLKWGVSNAVLMIMTGVVLLVMLLDVKAGLISAGVFIACIGYLNELRNALGRVLAYSDDIVEYKAALERASEIYNLKSNEDSGAVIGAFSSLSFKDVSFKYKDKVVLNGFSLDVKKGEKVGIVGVSGAGKSTLFKLILGLYTVNDGQVLINGVPVSEANKEKLAQVITIVPQEIEVFNLSFKDNVTMGELTAFSESRFKRSNVIAQCEKITNRLALGIDTLIGEKGVRLSGGERQRLGIARALYRDSDVVLFDEATSHLDSHTEGEILKALHEGYASKTVLFIAHRLSTLTSMDRIIVIDKGVIVESGDFRRLLNKKGVFYKLYNEQKKLEREL